MKIFQIGNNKCGKSRGIFEKFVVFKIEFK
jgi:hypothetical protein